MRKAAWLLAALATSCLLPQFQVDPSLGPAAGGTSAGSATDGNAGGTSAGSTTAGNASGGKSVSGGGVAGSNLPGEGGDAGMLVAAAGSGECTTAPYLTNCNGICRDVTGDFAHCGECDRGCPTGAQCLDSKCECPPNHIVCDGACQDSFSDQWCRNCETHCLGPMGCTGGGCEICPTGCAHLSTPILKAGASAYVLAEIGGTINLQGSTVTVRAYQSDPDYNSLQLVVIDDAGKIGTSPILTDVGLTTTKLVLTSSSADLTRIHFIGFQILWVKASLAGSQVWIDSLSIEGNPIGPFDFRTDQSPLGYDPVRSNAVVTVDWVGF